MKVCLSNYIAKIEEKYQEARKEWEKINNEIKTENKRFDKIEWLYLTPEGITAERNRHYVKLEEIRSKFGAVREKFEKDFEAIKESSDKVFDFGYKHKPELIDNNGLAIINNSNLDVNEIIDLAESYRSKGNMTMYFLVAEKLRGVGEGKDSRALTESERKARTYWEGAHNKRQYREDHDLLEGFKEVCTASLRDDVFLATNIQNLHEDFYNQHLNRASEIVVDTPAPWD